MKNIKTAFRVFLISFKVDFINSIIVLLISIILGLLPYLNTKGLLLIAEITDQSNVLLIILGILFVILATMGSKLINSLNNIFINKLSSKLEFKLKKDLKEKIVKIDYRKREQSSFQQELRMAYIALNPFGLVKMNSFVPLLLSNLITIITLSIVLIKFNVFIWMFIIIITCVTTIIRGKVIKENVEDDRNLIDDRMLEETVLGNITNSESYAELRLNNSVDWAIKKWENQQDKLFSKELKVNNKFQSKSEIISFIANDFCIIAALVVLILMNKIDITSIIIVFTAIQNLVNNFYIFSNEISITKNFLEMFSFYTKIFKQGDSKLINKKEVNPEKDLLISFKNVSFKYSDKYVLEDINFEINKGEKIAIVGYNGSGKTTLLKLLLGLYTPCDGNIFYNGCNDNERLSESVVFQDFARYKFSLKDNILLYNPNLNYSENQIKEILEKYKIGNLLSYGSNVVLANEFGGINLSTGQWQKLALIRSKLKEQYDIYVMDEATSALDSYTESEIINDILDESKTLIYVCHRLTCVKQFDKIVFINSGKIAGLGTHRDLIENNEKYKELYMSQAKEYIE